MRIRKEWTRWDPSANFKSIAGNTGIFEIADEQQQCLLIGLAGGTSPFGIRGELYRIFGMPPGAERWNWAHPHPEDVPADLARRAAYYRYEVNHNAYSRWVECLTRYREDYETLPEFNLVPGAPQVPVLGRYHWKSEGS